jgi:hypothetical protein
MLVNYTNTIQIVSVQQSFRGLQENYDQLSKIISGQLKLTPYSPLEMRLYTMQLSTLKGAFRWIRNRPFVAHLRSGVTNE